MARNAIPLGSREISKKGGGLSPKREGGNFKKGGGQKSLPSMGRGRSFQNLALLGRVNFRGFEDPWRSGFVKGEGVKKCFYKLPSVSGQIQRKS